jgi:hypothetical protein
MVRSCETDLQPLGTEGRCFKDAHDSDHFLVSRSIPDSLFSRASEAYRPQRRTLSKFWKRMKDSDCGLGRVCPPSSFVIAEGGVPMRLRRERRPTANYRGLSLLDGPETQGRDTCARLLFWL